MCRWRARTTACASNLRCWAKAETWLSFGLRNLDQHETLSIELTCTNQNLPRQLKLGDICKPCEDTPEFLSFRNISAVTRATRRRCSATICGS